MLNNDFTPVWESASPVRTVTFDLGEGRSLKGTVSGEIAIYFCTPAGKVFDILPALQSPAATLGAMTEALAFYKEQKGNPTPEAVIEYHRKRMMKAAGSHFDEDSPFFQRLARSRLGIIERENAINEAVDAATKDMRYMVFSKTFSTGTQDITVVEPGGKGYYLWELDRRFTNQGAWTTDENLSPIELLKQGRIEIALKTPEEWKKEVFESVLQQKLEGGEVLYDSSSLKAIRIIGE